jgi:hypothetical protein
MSLSEFMCLSRHENTLRHLKDGHCTLSGFQLPTYSLSDSQLAITRLKTGAFALNVKWFAYLSDYMILVPHFEECDVPVLVTPPISSCMAGAGADERWSLVWEVRWNFDSAKRG